MLDDRLSDDNFLLYAIKLYDNPGCKGIGEFYEDLNRIKYIKRLFYKYDCKKILKHKLLLNHILILNNIFGAEGSSRILFFKIEKKYHSYLKTFLIFLQTLPKEIQEVELDEIPIDYKIEKTLQDLKNEFI